MDLYYVYTITLNRSLYYCETSLQMMRRSFRGHSKMSECVRKEVRFIAKLNAGFV